MFWELLLYVVGVAVYLNVAGWEKLAAETTVTIYFVILPALVGGLLLFGWYRVTVPLRLIQDLQAARDALSAANLKLEDRLKPKLLIEYDEADSNSYHDSPLFHRPQPLHEIFDQPHDRKTVNCWRYCRLKLRNLSMVTAENVEVRLAAIEPFPDGLKGKLPLPLRFTHDNVPPYKRYKDINPDSYEFVDVIQQSWPEHGSAPYLVVQHSVDGVEGVFEVGEYRIKIEAAGRNVLCAPTYLNIGVKNKDGTGTKLWLWK
jgi:hypothetical protein